MSPIARHQLRQLERRARGRVRFFTLEDGARHYYSPEEAAAQLFAHCATCRRAQYLGEPLPDPPPVLQAVLRAQDRGIALEAVAGQFFYYDRDALKEQGQLVPRERSS
jgi:hypothetical protein